MNAHLRPFQGRRYHFSGVGGSGMAPLALLAASLGADVTGSDRNHDRGIELPIFDHLARGGVRLAAQDGSAVHAGLDAVVYSTAVERSNPDFRAAEELGVTLVRRGSFLASIAGARRAVAVAGTSGKSTVTAMVAHIFVREGLDPSFLGGGAAVDLPGTIPPGSLRLGGSDWFVVETDESDGSVAEFAPAISLLTNLSRDHKEIDETARNFGRLLEQTRETLVLHVGDAPLARVPLPAGLRTIRVAVEDETTWSEPDLVARRLRMDPFGVSYDLAGTTVRVPFPGRLTVENSLHAIVAATAAGIPLARAAAALGDFAGVRRRLERVGVVNDVDVFDDYAHNPVKIEAALEALRPPGSLWVYYQPHGYGPTRFFADALVETFKSVIRPGDRLLLAPIYDAGGTADRSIRSEDLVARLAALGVPATVAGTRDGTALLLAEARPGDRIVVMGARDDTLPLFARSLLPVLAARPTAAASRPDPR
ncbi:MAG TPA: Mur ligase domain-containing protein [Candidatus Eisenbacteria bacterium]|nr:Mur ligase domain-containing protein [Candidatus Eisenbacteria bacterium]